MDSREITDALSERYCEFGEVLAEVDLDALDRKIARLVRLRAIVAAVRGADHSGARPAPVVKKAPPPCPIPESHVPNTPYYRDDAPPDDDAPPGRTERWLDRFEEILRDGPKTIREIRAEIDHALSPATVCQYLRTNRARFKRLKKLGGCESMWSLVEKVTEPAPQLEGNVA